MEKSLEIFLKENYTLLEKANSKWAIIGSTASALQGCSINPHDVDIIVAESKVIFELSKNMTKYASKIKFEGNIFDSQWLSSKEQPVFEGKDQWGFYWTYAGWKLEGFEVQIAHILAPDEFMKKFRGIWEAGPYIFPHLNKIQFKNYLLPVVPLEIQLETDFSRNLDDRIKNKIEIFKKKGYNKKLIKEALDENHLMKFEELIKKIK